MAALAVATAAVIAGTVAGALPSPASAFYDENGPLEDTQAVLLAATAAMFACQALARRSGARVVAWALAALAVSFCVRELDLRGSTAPDWLAAPTYEPGQTIVILIISTAFCFHALRQRHHLREAVMLLVAPRTAIYFAAGVVLLVSGVAEHAHSLGAYAEVLEEWLELDGFAMLLLAGLFFPYGRLRPRDEASRAADAP